MIHNKYTIIEQIGKGNFGQIYKGLNNRSNEPVAIKIEKLQNGINLLKNETRIYNFLNGINGIPKIKWFGTDNNLCYMVMELLGGSIEELKQQQPSKCFSFQLVVKIGIQVLEILKNVHNKELIHRDIKPDNLLLGIHTPQIYLIDFGLAKRFMTNESTHIEKKEIKQLLGTPNFASINSHNLVELSRRDDIESLAYTLLYLYNGTLLWKNTNINIEEIKKIKMYFYDTVVSNKEYESNPFIDLLKYARELEFDECPNYDILLTNLNKQINIC
jgi:serine/threonine protein kinase